VVSKLGCYFCIPYLLLWYLGCPVREEEEKEEEEEVEEELNATKEDEAENLKSRSSLVVTSSSARKAKTLIGGRTMRLTWQETEKRRDSDALDLVTSSVVLPLVETSVALAQPPTNTRVVRRVSSFEDPRPLPAKTNYELRRCKSEVAQPSDPSAPALDAGNPSGTAQNALTSKDKIQAKFHSFLCFSPSAT
jgi:hypothetical protein